MKKKHRTKYTEINTKYCISENTKMFVWNNIPPFHPINSFKNTVISTWKT